MGECRFFDVDWFTVSQTMVGNMVRKNSWCDTGKGTYVGTSVT